MGRQGEKTDILWVRADQSNGLLTVPYNWAGVFAQEAARFLFPQKHFGLIDNDCVPITLFETQDLISPAESQRQWTDLVGHPREADVQETKLGVILLTETHLDCNGGPVISIGSVSRRSPIEPASTANTLACELADYRNQLLAMARPPENPTDAALSGSLSLH